MTGDPDGIGPRFVVHLVLTEDAVRVLARPRPNVKTEIRLLRDFLRGYGIEVYASEADRSAVEGAVKDIDNALVRKELDDLFKEGRRAGVIRNPPVPADFEGLTEDPEDWLRAWTEHADLVLLADEDYDRFSEIAAIAGGTAVERPSDEDLFFQVAGMTVARIAYWHNADVIAQRPRASWWPRGMSRESVAEGYLKPLIAWSRRMVLFDMHIGVATIKEERRSSSAHPLELEWLLALAGHHEEPGGRAVRIVTSTLPPEDHPEATRHSHEDIADQIDKILGRLLDVAPYGPPVRVELFTLPRSIAAGEISHARWMLFEAYGALTVDPSLATFRRPAIRRTELQWAAVGDPLYTERLQRLEDLLRRHDARTEWRLGRGGYRRKTRERLPA